MKASRTDAVSRAPLYAALLLLVGCGLAPGASTTPTAADDDQLRKSVEANRVSWCSECRDQFDDGRGINLYAALYWAGDRLFADTIKTSLPGSVRPDGNLDTDTPPPLDANGWPLTDGGFFLFPGGLFTGTTGRYSLSFTGQAIIGGTFAIEDQTFDGVTTKATAVRASDAAEATLIFANTGSGVKNVKLMRPGYTEADTFTTPIKDLIRKFRVIRAMDLSAVNWNAQVNWSDRVLPSYATQERSTDKDGYGWEGRGIAWEYVVQLANETGTNLWISVPAMVTDDYVRNLALLMRDGASGFAGFQRRIYLEFSNEVWNSSFGQFQQNYDAAVAEVNAGNSPLNYDNVNDEWTWMFRRTAKRAMEISRIFCDTFAEKYGMSAGYGDPYYDRRNRTVRPIFAWQQTNGQDSGRLGLNFLDNFYNNGDGFHVSDPHPPGYYFYGGGGSAYYNPNNDDPGLTLENFWTSETMRAELFAEHIRPDVDLAVAYGLRRVAYEGGPSLDRANPDTVGADTAARIDAVKAQAWADPRMATAITEHDQQWYRSGGDLLMYFQSTGDFQWGFTHDVTDLNTPKFAGLAASPLPYFNSLLTYGALVPRTIGTSVILDASVHSARNNWDSAPDRMSPGHWFSYTFRTNAGGGTKFPHEVGVSFTSSPGSQLEVIVDGVSRGVFTSSGAGTETVRVSNVHLFDDLHAVAVRCRAGSLSLQNVSATRL